jgi:protein-S-isoprenylcysteine O-methyltransferase Ste14
MPVNIPRLLIGILVAIYWARVLHLARKIRRRTGHTANVIPAEKSGRVTRVIWFPVVILWILIPTFSSFPLPWYSGGGSGWGPTLQKAIEITFTPFFDSPALQFVSLLIAFAAFFLTWICWQRMGKSWRMGIDPAEKTSLITTGPYARIRHPIYALSSLLMIATALAIPSPLMLLVAGTHLILLQLEARREEKYLIATHGNIYTEYLNRSTRFVPKLKRKPPIRTGVVHD